jgi:catechol 2,3-dioxygenase-like lactoylglutathione lyase family enzyme
VSTSNEAPRITGVLETALYVDDIDRAEQFYGEVLGLRQVGKEAGRHVFFRVGAGVLLLFRAASTRVTVSLPPHGADGPGHVCLTTDPTDYEPWKARLRERGVVIEHETVWERGRSFYFRDPDGNVLEVANADIWPR